DGIRDGHVTGVQTCALPILMRKGIAAVAETHRFQRVEGAVSRFLIGDPKIAHLEAESDVFERCQPGQQLVVLKYDAHLSTQVGEIGRASCRERVQSWVDDVR